MFQGGPRKHTRRRDTWDTWDLWDLWDPYDLWDLYDLFNDTTYSTHTTHTTYSTTPNARPPARIESPNVTESPHVATGAT